MSQGNAEKGPESQNWFFFWNNWVECSETSDEKEQLAIVSYHPKKFQLIRIVEDLYTCIDFNIAENKPVTLIWE